MVLFYTQGGSHFDKGRPRNIKEWSLLSRRSRMKRCRQCWMQIQTHWLYFLLTWHLQSQHLNLFVVHVSNCKWWGLCWRGSICVWWYPVSISQLNCAIFIIEKMFNATTIFACKGCAGDEWHTANVNTNENVVDFSPSLYLQESSNGSLFG